MTGDRGIPKRLLKRLSQLDRPVKPRLDPAARTAVDGLVRQLASVTPEQRQEMVAALLVRASPPELTVVVNSIVTALLQSPAPTTRLTLAIALTEIGPCVASEVRLAFLSAREDWQQAALAGVLTRVGPFLPRVDQIELLSLLIAKIGALEGDEAVEAVGQAIAILRISLEQPHNQ